MTIWHMSPWKLIMAGGPVMAPILLCSIFAIAIIISRMWYFSAISTNTYELKKLIFDHIKNNNIAEAINLCDASRAPLAKILKAGIVKFGHPSEEIRENMEDASLFEIPKLEKRLSSLATIAHIAPLLGLLGTVTGISGSFYTIQIRAASLNPSSPGDLAGGIWEALITTIAGLIVAIPAYVAYNYLVSCVNTIVLEMERGATELAGLLTQISSAKPTKWGGYKSEV